MKWLSGIAISIALLIVGSMTVSATAGWDCYCANTAPSLFPNGVAAGSSVSLNGPDPTVSGQVFTYSWIAKKFTGGSTTGVTLALASTKTFTFTVPTDAERVDVRLTVSNDADSGCQDVICDWFWINYPCTPTTNQFCDEPYNAQTAPTGRQDVQYDYTGPAVNIGYKVKNSAGITVQVSNPNSPDPFTASFATSPTTYPVGTYTVHRYLYKWDGTTQRVDCIAGTVTIVEKPVGSISIPPANP